MMMKYLGVAPINIALIKYMGKRPASEGSNLSDNLSLSYTSPRFLTRVECWEDDEAAEDSIVCCGPDGSQLTLSKEGHQKFMQHVVWLKEKMHIRGQVSIRSHNNFPLGCGIASSASSFAALTQALSYLAGSQHGGAYSVAELAQLSREGSGSSCRSFYGPWALWQGDRVELAEMGWTSLIHRVVVIDDVVKAVSSSEAHQRVRTSPHYAGRSARVQQRYQTLIQAGARKDWAFCRQVIDQEWRDMHELFHTAAEPFRYVTDGTQEVLDWLDARWQSEGDGPWVTLDAGPNIHLLFRPGCEAMVESYCSELQKKYEVM